MAPKRRLPQTFPHRVILVTSLTLCMCALGGMVLAVLSWSHRIWGYYFGTGFWSGGVILLTGIFGIVASFVRNACSVKTFMIFSIFGFVVSLAVIALSCGGLDLDSGFYEGYSANTVMHYICHGGYLGLGVLQIFLCILSDAISIYYLFVEYHAEIYSVKLRGKNKPLKRSRPRSKDSTRASTASSAPLIGGSIRSRSDSKGSKKGKKSKENNTVDGDETDAPIYRNRGSFVKSENVLDPTTPIRSPCIRPASFTTFGHTDAQSDRASLIVHPGDNMSVADTNYSQMSGESSPYAHTMLFWPPLPIEEDEELPPYEQYEGHLDANADSQITSQGNQDTGDGVGPGHFLLRRAISAPLYGKRRRVYKRSSQGNSSNMLTRQVAVDAQHPKHNASNEFAKYIIDRPDLSSRRSQSDDLLNECNNSNDAIHDQMEQSQGVQLRNFSKSTDKILYQGELQRSDRSQSVKTPRETRLDRRKRALSVEFKPTKENNIEYNDRLDPERKVHPAHDSTSALYACTKTLPSKFSLRTRLSRKGPREAIPVKSVSTLPLFSPPPKPPRTHSVTLEDLRDLIEKKGYQSEDMKPETENNFNSFTSKFIENNPSQDKQDDAFDSRSTETRHTNEYATVDEMKELKSSQGASNSTSSVEKQESVRENAPIQTLNAIPTAVNSDEINSKTDDDVFLPPNPDSKHLRESSQDSVKTVKVNPQTVSVTLQDKPASVANADIVFSLNGEKSGLKKVNESQEKSNTAEITLDSGPVLRFKSPQENNKVNVDANVSNTGSIDGSARDSAPPIMESTITLPVSPVIKQPVVRNSSEMKNTAPANPLYARKEKKPPVILPKPQSYRLPSSATNHTDQKPPALSDVSVERSVDNRSRPPLLSPSERILQRHNDRPIINTQGVQKSETNFRPNEVGRNLFLTSAENNGARPKTTFFRRSNSEDPDERPIRPLIRDDPRGVSNINRNRPSSLSNSRVYPSHNVSPLSSKFNYQPKFSFAYPDQTSPTSGNNPRSSFRNSSTVQSVINVTQPDQKAQHSNGASAQNGTGPVAFLSRSGSSSSAGSGSSQGVLHLVQPYHQRQVTNNTEGSASDSTRNGNCASPEPPQVPLPQQNNIQQQDEDKPLFSVVL